MNFYIRSLSKILENTTNTFSATYLNGPRQCGKSTLVQNFLPEENANYLTFDTTAVRTAAKRDPEAFISGLPENKINIIDEVQRVPSIHMIIKKAIDEKRLKGQSKSLFLLTGSANIFGLPNLAKAMVGRMALLTLFPFSAAEMNKSGINFIEKLWNGNLTIRNYKRVDLIKTIKNATFPEIALNKNINQNIWMDSYIDTILERDAVEFAKIKKPELILQLLASLCCRIGSLLNNDNVMSETGLNQITYDKYKSFCNNAYLTFEVQPWAKPNRLNKRFVKSKKLYFADTNFLCHSLRRDISDVYKNDPSQMGHIFENFIATEIMKSIYTLPDKYYLSHFNPVRGDGKETDFIVEKDNGEIIAIEVKLDSTLNENNFKNLTTCRNITGKCFKRGFVIYTGQELVPFGENFWAVPVNYLWE
ncbi:MAG: ATP-binding protein [Treponema sp.]|nr:ATP-binding protein [Treponema sp.]MCL2272463.1 ATP-binding protein [Treponema sp.]